MALDANLFAQFGQRPRSMGDYRQELDMQAANALALKANNLNYQNALQAQQDDQAYRDAAKGFTGDAVADVNMLRSRGLAKQATAYEKQLLDSQKAKADINQSNASAENSRASAAKSQTEAYQARLGLGMKILQSANSPQATIQFLTQAVQSGQMTREEAIQNISDMPQDPAGFQQWKQGQLLEGMEIGKRLELAAKKEAEERQAANEMMVRDPKTGKWVVNEALVGAKARVAQSGAMNVSLGTPVPVMGPDGKTVMVQPPNRPGATPVVMTDPVTGKPFQPAKDPNSEKPLTEGQGIATTFAARMRGASEVIEKMESEGVSGSDVKTLAAGNQYTNFLASPQGQQYRQAQENWVTANLRKESGAAIPVEEMNKDIAKWFPKVGDSKAVRDQKAQARKVAEEGMLVQAGPGAKQVPGILSRSAPVAAGAFSDAEKERRYQEWKAKQGGGK